MDIAAWLRGLGLERFEPAFRESEIEIEVLPELTEADLVSLGLPLGPRRKLLKEIAALRQAATPAPAAAPLAEAERILLVALEAILQEMPGERGSRPRQHPVGRKGQRRRFNHDRHDDPCGRQFRKRIASPRRGRARRRPGTLPAWRRRLPPVP